MTAHGQPSHFKLEPLPKTSEFSSGQQQHRPGLLTPRPAGCGAGDPTNCAQLRGEEYNYIASSSWIPNLANLTAQIYDLGLESNLGYTGNGQYGFDDITLGW
jgi:hypothetical protein